MTIVKQTDDEGSSGRTWSDEPALSATSSSRFPSSKDLKSADMTATLVIRRCAWAGNRRGSYEHTAFTFLGSAERWCTGVSPMWAEGLAEWARHPRSRRRMQRPLKGQYRSSLLVAFQ
ncbi:hypothetical protein OG568_41490 [Streptomyces sp. NBC_01450]|uniref:hypothetical protein n=1 Tax=Streptomyces sp. NBC_01450 TaxID=2903871 RepID=UPI002E332C6A|nr:hypothetical protein [Streptomyces sp. NBC_01450]